MGEVLGIMYESNEWSDHKLARELAAQGFDVRMLDMQRCGDAEVLGCDFLVSRVFASAQFRGHQAALERMPRLLGRIDAAGIALVNPSRAHGFEVSKELATRALAEAGVGVPEVLGAGVPAALEGRDFACPCIVKPDCGGRGTLTTVAHTPGELAEFLAHAPELRFVVERYVEAAGGFLTRVEIVDGRAALILKRSVAANGLSGYHHGSTYDFYPEVSAELVALVERAAAELSILFGSFDVIEALDGPRVIDANSVSNVSEDCTELFGGFDLMHEHAVGIARHFRS